MDNINEEKIEDILSDEIDLEDSDSTEESNSESSDAIYYLNSGEALNSKETYEITAREKTKLVVLAGLAGSGKTTIETSLYQMFQKKTVGGFYFAGSNTIQGYEQRAFFTRTKSRGTTPTTQRTSLEIGRSFLHLRLWERETDEFCNLLFADLSGEAFETHIGRVDEVKQDFPFMDRADYFVGVLDGEMINNIQTEMPIKFKLKRMEKDTQYLYSLEKKWLAVEPLERTVIGQEVSELTLLLTDGNQDLEVEFPDLSGETFQNIYENREMSQHLYQKICDANAILYFINVENIYHGQLISEVSEEIRNAGQEEYRERKPSQDDPTQIQIIDLLQAIAEIKRSQVKLGIIFSAWDLIDDMENVNPRKYLKNNMNMLWQYLEANCRKFDTVIWGVSALGGKLDDFEELLDIEDPITRIKVINENKSISHDVTSIIAEMSGETNGY